MKKIVIVGTGQLAQVAYVYFINDSLYNVVAFSADENFLDKESLFNLPIVSFEKIEHVYPPYEYDLFIAIGYSSLNKKRVEKYEAALQKGYNLISYIHSSVALISKGSIGAPSIGKNCFILENQVIQPFSKIGDNVTLWSGNHIGHHSIISDHCFIASHVVVAGNVTIDPYCFLGINSTIRDGVRIGRETIIGAGALILKNIEANGLYKSSMTSRDSRKSYEISL